ncbi:unnamed protein product, partial [Ixodes hexagonus]
FFQVGPSNVIYSQIRFIQPNNEWFSLQRLKAVEAKLSATLESRLDDINSLKPGTLETVNGDVTMENVKVTYNLRKRTTLPRYVIQTRAPKKPRHVDESICKYNDYGGMFERKNVIRAELVVVIRRLTASELAKQLGLVHVRTNFTASPYCLSSHFESSTVAIPHLPHAVDAKNSCSTLMSTMTYSVPRSVSSLSMQTSRSSNFRELSNTNLIRSRPPAGERLAASAKSTVSFSSMRWSSCSRHVSSLCSVSACWPSNGRPQPSELEARKTKQRTMTQEGKYIRKGKAKQSGIARYSQRLLSPDQERTISHVDSLIRALLHPPPSPSLAKNSGKGERTGRSNRKKRNVGRRFSTFSRWLTQSEGWLLGGPVVFSSGFITKKGRYSWKLAHGSLHGRRSRRRRRPRQTSSAPGTDESNARAGSVALPKNSEFFSESSKFLPASVFLILSDLFENAEPYGPVRPRPRRRTASMSARCCSHTHQRHAAMRRHRAAVVTLWRASQARDAPPKAAYSRANDVRPALPIVTKALVLVRDHKAEKTKQHCESNILLLVKHTAHLINAIITVRREVASLRPPVETIEGCAKRVPSNTTPGHHCEDGMGTKNFPPPEGTEVMAEAVHTGRVAVEFDRTDYIPRRRGGTLSLGHGRSRRPEEKPKRREEYVPSSLASTTSGSRSSRGRYEEYVPEAVGSTSRRHQTTVDYVPTPKKEAAAFDAPTTTTSALPLSELPEAKYRSGSNANHESSSGRTNSILEQEIRTASEVKDLEERHIKYLFHKCLPDMAGIIKRKVESWRNADYHRGGKAKRSLTYKVYFSLFSGEQMNLISNLFIEEFVVRQRLSGDYLNQVLIPEFLIRVVSANKGLSHQESDALMESVPFDVFPIPLH